MSKSCTNLIEQIKNEIIDHKTIRPKDNVPQSFISSRMSAISFSGIRRSFDLAQKIPGLISLGLGEPDFDTPLPIREAAKVALDKGDTHYTPNAGYIELRKTIAKKLELENNITTNPEQDIVVTVGGAEALFLTCQVLVSPGDEVLVSDPAFVNYEPCIRAAGGVPVFVPLDEKLNFHFNAETIKAKITPKTKGIIINSPHNPTGHVLNRKDLEDIAALAIKYNLFVISDEVYEKIIYSPAKHFSIASLPNMFERTITICSFSKSYAMSGWRIGYAAGDHSIIEQITKLQQFCGIHAPSFAQRAAEAALNNAGEWLKDMVTEYNARRDFLVKAVNEIPGLSAVTPDGAFYLFVNAKSFGRPSQEIADHILNDGKVAVVAGSALGKHSEGYLRLCYTVPVPKLKEAVMRIKAALAKLR